jgi:Helix-turn-helix domain
MTNDEINEAVRLYVDDSPSIRAIATKLGKSKGSVWKALHERGVRMRPAHQSCLGFVFRSASAWSSFSRMSALAKR